MIEDSVKTNSGKAWLLAARPKTLTGAAVPVMIASGMAWHAPFTTGTDFWIPSVLCFLFAFCMQIDANFINDYFDFVKGGDGEDRLGPRRACAQGWITLPAMKCGIVLTTILSALTGLPLVFYGGWNMLLVGLACIVFCFLYTVSFSRHGLGDILVLVFFGIVPVCTTYYILCRTCTWDVFLLSIACGLVIDTLLVLNNYRDREQDKAHGKITLLVRMSPGGGQLFYWLLGVAGSLLTTGVLLHHHLYGTVLLLFYLLLHTLTGIHMRKIRAGRALNKILGETARNIFIFGVLTTISLLLG